MIQRQNMYLENSVRTASPGQLLIMLYDIAIRNAKNAMEFIDTKKYDQASEHLVRAQGAIEELMSTLNMDIPVSKNLMMLYEYFLHRLIEGNVSKNNEPIKEVLGHLVDLKSTWVEAIRITNAQRNGSNGSVM